MNLPIVLIVLFIIFILILSSGKKEENKSNLSKLEINKIPEKSGIQISTLILKPKSLITLDDFVGQKKAKEYIKMHLNSVKKNKEAFPHTIFWGQGGLGKSTLAKIIADEMGGNYTEVTPAVISDYNQVMNLFLKKKCLSCGHLNSFTVLRCGNCRISPLKSGFKPEVSLEERDVIFIDEIHALAKNLRTMSLEELLYSAMQDNYIIAKFQGNPEKMNLPQFTLAGATTKLGYLSEPLLQRFVVQIHLNPYQIEELIEVGKLVSKTLGIKISDKYLYHLAKRSHGIPRNMKGLLKDLTTLGRDVTIKNLTKLFSVREIDKNGLDPVDRKILLYLFKRSKGAGSRSIANATGITSKEFEDVREHNLIYHDLIIQSDRGRTLTEKAKQEYFNG